MVEANLGKLTAAISAKVESLLEGSAYNISGGRFNTFKLPSTNCTISSLSVLKVEEDKDETRLKGIPSNNSNRLEITCYQSYPTGDLEVVHMRQLSGKEPVILACIHYAKGENGTSGTKFEPTRTATLVDLIGILASLPQKPD